jgi:hypothetical protein
MNQHDLNRAVAEATGETVITISRIGFAQWEQEKNCITIGD